MKTKEEWTNLWKEMKDVSPDTAKLPLSIWLSATEGDIGKELGRLDHCPEGVEAMEGAWRDYYAGEQLRNYTKPWKGHAAGDTYNYIQFYPRERETRTWSNGLCLSVQRRGCPCTYDSRPLICTSERLLP